MGSADIKRKLRLAAQRQEARYYADKAPVKWFQALAPLGTDANKPFLERVPWLIAVFQQRFGILEGGTKLTLRPAIVGWDCDGNAVYRTSSCGSSLPDPYTRVRWA